ncbi:Hypothetical predicted protein [Paramuricea clavata]|uniref:Uncharacterized protein n=1 Tax=Paramuricea clavata TaxID=317549 RepID=A0A6S7J933_PARCT|nr:Hypothetical predicted protein [Paramuricea clavata]
MKKQQSEMDVKLRALNFRLKRCDEDSAMKIEVAVDRHRESITTILSTISILKGSIEEATFAQSESDESIQQWSTEIENQIALADKCTQKLADFVKTIYQRAQEVELKHTQEQTMQFEKQLLEQNTRRIATLMSTTTTKVEEYDLSLEAILRKFVLNARVTKINKRELLTLDNPNYEGF